METAHDSTRSPVSRRRVTLLLTISAFCCCCLIFLYFLGHFTRFYKNVEDVFHQYGRSRCSALSFFSRLSESYGDGPVGRQDISTSQETVLDGISAREKSIPDGNLEWSPCRERHRRHQTGRVEQSLHLSHVSPGSQRFSEEHS